MTAILVIAVVAACNNRCDCLEAPDPATSLYVLPYPVGAGHKLFQTYCDKLGHRNRIAYDFLMPMGAEITSCRNGVVIEIIDQWKDSDHLKGHNNRVVVRHADSSIAWYGHLQSKSVAVAAGNSVKQGQLLGRCGTSGHSGGIPHLHFKVFKSRKYDYSDAIPVSFRNARGPLDEQRFLMIGELYTALAYEPTE